MNIKTHPSTDYAKKAGSEKKFKMWVRCLTSVLPSSKQARMTVSSCQPGICESRYARTYECDRSASISWFGTLAMSPFVLCESVAQIGFPAHPVAEAIRSGVSFADITHILKTSATDLARADDDSWTCLHWAVEMGRRDLVPIFLDAAPLLLHMKTREGLSAINISAWRGDRAMVELLLKEGAEIDEKTKWGETPLHHAVTFGHVEVVKLLLANGADPFMEDRLQRSPFSIAMQRGSDKMKKVFSSYVKK